ncbi:isochorismate synthase [Rothia sp. P7181]|uniref:isochorismate synthase n=1 Tax=Rothia sp. P7181 TaxID=3402663 RepID=UPI003ADFE7E2
MPTNEYPAFQFTYGDTCLRALGQLEPVNEKDALKRAQERGTGVIGVIPFDPQEPALLYVPETIERTPAPTVQEKTCPSPTRIEGIDNPEYRQNVGRAVEKMNNGELDKVVLSRLLHVYYEEDRPTLENIYHNLWAQQPRAYVFSMKLSDQSYLMGASPELVFGVEDGVFTTFPLAGSSPRTAPIGSTEDAQIGEALMRSAKDRAEHATVVADIKRCLSPVTEELHVPATPQLINTPQLWHLATKITGRLKDGMSALDGARAIHPTPAICGYPTHTARQVIRELESFERGFFGGLVGWMDPSGDGQWALVLRCAQVEPDHITLFAGAGLVKASTPDSEHRETGTKLGSFGQALNIKTVSS